MLLFQIEQETLRRQPAAVTGQTAVRTDDAMARHDDRERVLRIRGADRARCGRIADAARNLAIRRSRAIWNAAQLEPDLLLELRTLWRQRQIERGQLAGEIRFQLRSRLVQCAGTALPIASRTIRRWTPNFRATPLIVPTPCSYSRRICSNSSTFLFLLSRWDSFPGQTRPKQDIQSLFQQGSQIRVSKWANSGLFRKFDAAEGQNRISLDCFMLWEQWHLFRAIRNPFYQALAL